MYEKGVETMKSRYIIGFFTLFLTAGILLTASYQYTFTAPGTYQVAVVGTVTTLAGEKQILLRKSVTVTE